ncbi:DUF2254 domain-containing protein [Bacillus infantis]|uniref:DUF2254 domain-containing protein n=1 Tax=Bacillus infantis TaxID=324767 RepID=UPI0021553A12|nr:DUF2254 domain-containing protein [Bacillus infantis]MCR6613432.1 DUF2254 domain-containing protein [Bacillus infantis]
MVKQFLFKIKEGTWFIPAVYTIVALILAIVVVYVDFYLEAFYPEIFLVGLDLGKTILGTIAGSLLTMTTITFSTTMVVLTTYSSQFSPRTLENFIQDPVTMRVLGVFIGGFVYCIFTLLFIRESVGNTVASATIGVIIAFICLAFFAYFIYHVATSIQVGKLIKRLADDVLDMMKREKENFEEHDHVSLLQVRPSVVMEAKAVKAKRFGYIQYIDEDKLMQHAAEQGTIIEVLKPIGLFVTDKHDLLCVHNQEEIPEGLEDAVIVGTERTTYKDVDFGLQKIAEVALRAVSPGINDPNTAIQCIHSLSVCLSASSHLDGSVKAISDEEGRMKVIIPQRSFEELLNTSFRQISHYAKDDFSVMQAIFKALEEIGTGSGPAIRKALNTFADYLKEQVETASLTKSEKEELYKVNLIEE